VWSIKLQKISAVLQTNDHFNPSLLEAFLQIKDDAKCNATYYGAVTDRMVCAGPHSGYTGPCHVSSL
jgi:hypothetical protein